MSKFVGRASTTIVCWTISIQVALAGGEALPRSVVSASCAAIEKLCSAALQQQTKLTPQGCKDGHWAGGYVNLTGGEYDGKKVFCPKGKTL